MGGADMALQTANSRGDKRGKPAPCPMNAG